MAALQQDCNLSNPISRQRYGHNSRRQSESRKQRVENQPLFSQLPTPIATRDGSSLSLSAPCELSRGTPMERTPSGDSIVSNTPLEQHSNYTLRCSDKKAAQKVKSHFNRVSSNSKHARYLKALIGQGSSCKGGKIDESALQSIFTAMDSVFFGGRLKCRVRWRWSCEDRYQTDLIGTTALRLRRSDGDGYETMIVLSKPILTNELYDRRLLLSTFIHELIHCYLFIMCGFDARRDGGHTKGFREIAGMVDKWASPGDLNLCKMKANLNQFRKDQPQSQYFSLPAEDNQVVDTTYAGWRTPDQHAYHPCERYAQQTHSMRGYPEEILTEF